MKSCLYLSGTGITGMAQNVTVLKYVLVVFVLAKQSISKAIFFFFIRSVELFHSEEKAMLFVLQGRTPLYNDQWKNCKTVKPPTVGETGLQL